MDIVTQGFLIMAAFALAHERVLEFVRWFMARLPASGPAGRLRALLDALTAGPWAIVPGIALALGSNANLLDAFQLNADKNPIFFDHYLHGYPDSCREVVGCLLMGLSVTLGSSFWHDLAKGLIDARTRLRSADSLSVIEEATPPPPPARSRRNVVVPA